jgi:hypothetical protein
MTDDTLRTGFSHNWRNHIYIDVAGNKDPKDTSKADFKTLDNFITGITPTPGDKIDSSNYWVDKDNTNHEVTGHDRTWNITGNVLQGDPACDYIQSLEDNDVTGDDVKTLVKFTKANGVVKIYQCSIENIVTIGGNGNAKSNMTFTLAANGMAEVTTPSSSGAGVATQP